MRILIIEDDRLLREQLMRRFQQRGFEVEGAQDGEEGLRLFEAHPPDAVVTDLLMPNKEGIETIGALRRVSRETPIVAISGGVRGGGDFLHVAELMGAQASFHKPFDFEDLIAKIRELLKLEADPTP